MRIIKHRPSKKNLILIFASILLAGAIVCGALYSLGYFTAKPTPATTINYGPPTTDQTTTGAAIKSSSANSSAGKSTNSSDTPPAPTPITGSTKKSVQVSITASGQNNSLYQIRALIGALMDDGTCTLVLTQGPNSVTKTATTQALASSSTCRGFDIPVSELGTGQWQLDLSVSSPTLIGSVNSTITVK